MNKQETLKEAFKCFKEEYPILKSYNLHHLLQVARFGAKWQQEQDKNKYSEAIDIFEYILEYDDGVGIALGYNSRVMIERFINQFKNK